MQRSQAPSVDPAGNVLPTAPPPARDPSFQRVVDSIHDYAIFTLDVEGRVSSWNLGAERLKGWRAEEIVGRPFSALFTDEDQRTGVAEAEMAHARRYGRFDGEGWRQRKDGTRFWAGVTLTALQDDAGGLLGYVKVTRDLSPRLRAEHLLRARSRMQQSVNRIGIQALQGKPVARLMERAARDVSLALDADLALILERARDRGELAVRAGYAAEEDPSAVRVRGGRGSFARYVLGSQEPILIDDLLCEPRFERSSDLRAQGFRSVIAAPIQDAGPAFGLLVVCSREPSAFTQDEVQFVQSVANILQLALDHERHEAELTRINEQLEQRVGHRTRELLQANRELQAFTYVVSHDLKEPVRALGVSLSMARLDLDDPTAARSHIERAQRTADQLATLLDGLLEWSRLSMGAIELVPVSIPDLVAHSHCHVQWADLLGERDGSFHVDARIPPVMATPAMICQVLGNLAVNALKHNPRPGPRVDVRFVRTRDDGRIEIVVDDNGPGFPDAVVERFERLRSGDPRTIKGGFGLVLTARAVEKLGGEMRIERTDEGGGRVRLILRGAAPSQSLRVEDKPRPTS